MISALQVAADTQAPIYQWTDKQGQVHFGDKPVEGDGARSLAPPPVTVIDNSRTAAQERLLEVMSTERQQQKQAKQQQRLERAERKKKCEQLGEQLNELEHGHVVYYRENETGEREYIEDNERDRMATEHRTLFEENCQ